MAFDLTDGFKAYFKNGFEIHERMVGVESPKVYMHLVDLHGNRYDLTGLQASSITVSLRCYAWGSGRSLKTGQAVVIENATTGEISFNMASAVANDLPPGHDVFVLIIIDLEADALGIGLANPVNKPMMRIIAK